jgi:hypothetical protein
VSLRGTLPAMDCGSAWTHVEPASVMSEQQLERKLKLPHGIAGRQSRDFAECGSTEVIECRPIKHRVIREIECFISKNCNHAASR